MLKTCSLGKSGKKVLAMLFTPQDQALDLSHWCSSNGTRTALQCLEQIVPQISAAEGRRFYTSHRTSRTQHLSPGQILAAVYIAALPAPQLHHLQ